MQTVNQPSRITQPRDHGFNGLINGQKSEPSGTSGTRGAIGFRTPNMQRTEQAVQVVNGLNKNCTGQEHEAWEKLPPVVAKKAAKFVVNQTTPKSKDLVKSFLSALIKKLQEHVPGNAGEVKQEILEKLEEAAGCKTIEFLGADVLDRLVGDVQFMSTIDNVIRNRNYAEALGIKDKYFFNTANTGAEAINDEYTKEQLKALLKKLDEIPVFGVPIMREKGKRLLRNELVPLDNLGKFLSDFKLPFNQTGKQSTLIGSITFKNSKAEYTCLINMNSGTSRSGHELNLTKNRIGKRSTEFVSQLNLSSTDPEIDKGYQAVAQSICFTPNPKSTEKRKDFFTWILNASRKTDKNQNSATHLLHICARDLIDLGILEKGNDSEIFRVLPRVATQRVSQVTETPKTEKENQPDNATDAKSSRATDTANQRLYDTEHMMLTLTHELSKFIESEDKEEPTIDIALLSSYKACVSCTRGITSLPFNPNFSKLQRFFYLQTSAHDYEITNDPVPPILKNAKDMF